MRDELKHHGRKPQVAIKIFKLQASKEEAEQEAIFYPSTCTALQRLTSNAIYRRIETPTKMEILKLDIGKKILLNYLVNLFSAKLKEILKNPRFMIAQSSLMKKRNICYGVIKVKEGTISRVLPFQKWQARVHLVVPLKDFATYVVVSVQVFS